MKKPKKPLDRWIHQVYIEYAKSMRHDYKLWREVPDYAKGGYQAVAEAIEQYFVRRK